MAKLVSNMQSDTLYMCGYAGVAAGLVGALALPMTLTTAMKVAFGSKWLVALRRAQAAGKMLAIQLAQVSTALAGGQLGWWGDDQS